jgi:hypothetical protein
VATVPVRPEDVTPEWLTQFLAPSNPGVLVEDIEIIDSTQGAATRLRVRPRYAPGHDGGLPEVLFLKTSLTRQMFVADPHMYVTEVLFYERIRPELTCETPEVFGYGLDLETSRFALVIEDLLLRDAVFPSALSGLTGEDLAPLMSTFARLHAPYWGRADLRRRFDWLETTSEGKSARWWIEGAPDVVANELEQEYKAAALGGLPLDRLYAAVARLQAVNDEGPLTVIHGDTHIGNCYLLPREKNAGLLDWQLMRVANWGNDIGYVISTALDVDERRRSERDLLEHYLDELRSLGVEAPAWEDAWRLYRQQMAWGIITWLVTPTSMYSEPLLDALISRCVAATEDHGSLDLLLKG